VAPTRGIGVLAWLLVWFWEADASEEELDSEEEEEEGEEGEEEEEEEEEEDGATPSTSSLRVGTFTAISDAAEYADCSVSTSQNSNSRFTNE